MKAALYFRFQMFDCLLLGRFYTTLREHVTTTVMRLLHLWRKLTCLKCIFIASIPAPLSKTLILYIDPLIKEMMCTINWHPKLNNDKMVSVDQCMTTNHF